MPELQGLEACRRYQYGYRASKRAGAINMARCELPKERTIFLGNTQGIKAKAVDASLTAGRGWNDCAYAFCCGAYICWG